MITKFKIFEINLNEFNATKIFFKVNTPITEFNLGAVYFKLEYDYKHLNMFIKGVVNNVLNRNYNYIYLGFKYDFISDETVQNYMGDKDGFEYYTNSGYVYCGEIDLTEDDIEKYEIYLNSKKYNL